MESAPGQPIREPRHHRERVTGAFLQAVTRLTGLRTGFIPAYMRRQMEIAGVHQDMLDRVVRKIERLRDWPYAWEAEGDHQLARGNWQQACVAYYLAQRVLLTDSPLKRRLYGTVTDLYPHLEHRSDLEALAVPYGGGTIAAYLQMPVRRAKGRRVPLVIMVPGITCTKEELHVVAEPMLERGFAVCRIDNPGYGETTGSFNGEMPNHPAFVMNALASDPRIDPESIHFWGMSLGGFFALHAAAVSRPASVVTISAPFHPAAYAHRLPRMNLTALRHMLGVDTFHELFATMDAMSLAPRAAQIVAPVKLFSAGRDRTIPHSEAELIVSAVSGPTSVTHLPDDGHACLESIEHVIGESLAWMGEPVAITPTEDLQMSSLPMVFETMEANPTAVEARLHQIMRAARATPGRLAAVLRQAPAEDHA